MMNINNNKEKSPKINIERIKQKIGFEINRITEIFVDNCTNICINEGGDLSDKSFFEELVEFISLDISNKLKNNFTLKIKPISKSQKEAYELNTTNLKNKQSVKEKNKIFDAIKVSSDEIDISIIIDKPLNENDDNKCKINKQNSFFSTRKSLSFQVIKNLFSSVKKLQPQKTLNEQLCNNETNLSVRNGIIEQNAVYLWSMDENENGLWVEAILKVCIRGSGYILMIETTDENYDYQKQILFHMIYSVNSIEWKDVDTVFNIKLIPNDEIYLSMDTVELKNHWVSIINEYCQKNTEMSQEEGLLLKDY